MVFFGFAMILLSFLGLVYRKWATLENRTIFLKLSILMIFSPYIANTFGWIMSEIGRQPWIVQGLFQTADAVSPNVSSGDILFSLISFSLIFTLLLIAMIYLFVRVIKQGPFKEEEQIDVEKDPFEQGGLEHATE